MNGDTHTNVHIDIPACVGWSDINIHIGINMNIDIHIIINMIFLLLFFLGGGGNTSRSLRCSKEQVQYCVRTSLLGGKRQCLNTLEGTNRHDATCKCTHYMYVTYIYIYICTHISPFSPPGPSADGPSSHGGGCGPRALGLGS